MDSNRRPPYPQHYPPAPPPHAPQHHPPAALDPRPPPPPFAQSHQHPPPQQHPHYQPFPPPPGPALAPINAPPHQPAHSLPPLQHPQQSQHPHQPPPTAHPQQQHHPHPAPHDARDAPDYSPYNPQSRSNQATPAPNHRSYSTDSAHHQRTPTSPLHSASGPGPYPSAPAPDAAAAPPPPPQPMDHGAHHYPPPNGLPHGMPQGPHPQQGPPQGPPPHHEPPPHYMTPVMDNHHAYGGPPPPSQGMYPQNFGPTSSNYISVQKRKQMRATQACEQCRQRKQKCDEGNPCSFCKENNLQCQYRDTPPAKTDKNMEKLLAHMETHTAQLENLTNKIDDFDNRLRTVEHSGLSGYAATDSNEVAMAEEAVEQPSSPEEATGQLQDIDDHRTAPHKLILLWPSVKALLQDAKHVINDSYVMDVEDRGVLRIYTRGEGVDDYEGVQQGAPASPAQSEESGEGNTPSPPHGVWGSGFPRTPSSEASRSDPNSVGGLKSDGTLDLEVNTINTLYDSYMRHIHVMHPFLDRSRLRKSFDHFIMRYSTSLPALRQKFAVGNSSDNERPSKRQRSNGSTVIGTHQQQEHTILRNEPTERSPGNAIVWLVLALGKICMQKEPLQHPAIDQSSHPSTATSHHLSGPGIIGSSPASATIKPNEMSPKSTPNTQPTPSSMEGVIRAEHHSRRPSVDASSRPRNLDLVPGLAYYAKAAEIMGDQGDGNDLMHAQMFLLAGLYKGQLARVKESMSWYILAGRAARMLLDRYKLYSKDYWGAHMEMDVRQRHELGRARIKDKRHNLIVLASWTCLQLESDILAEMRLPSSGIAAVENVLPMPHNMPDNDEGDYQGLDLVHETESDGNILLFYTAQMFLRKRLNQIHKEMYGDKCLNQTLNQVQAMLVQHKDTLDLWRSSLPPGLRWDDKDKPPSDILEARLRAKYWGARYLVNRPFLDYALHVLPHTAEGRTIEQSAVDNNGNPRDRAEVHLFRAIEKMGETDIWEATRRCIEAAMQSTVAFDGVPDRLIVTGIHGTAHAQFGNMLVLSAAYWNNWLRALVPQARYEGLLERTITFLKRLAPISPTCRDDCHILTKIQACIFGGPPGIKQDPGELSVSRSFGPST